MKIFNYLPVLLLSISLFSCAGDKDKDAETAPEKMELREEAVNYSEDTTSLNGYVVWNNGKEGRRPVVLVVHEWWGNNVYPKTRAKELAKLGYLAMAVDLYGNGKIAEDPQTATALAMPFYQDPEFAKRRFDAALEKIRLHPQADTSQIAAIGYCFGGQQVLNFAKMGENLKGVVSFHGSLGGVPVQKEKLRAAILVCHGEDDEFVDSLELVKFKRDMDSIGADYTFKTYPDATHAFTNPSATTTGQKFGIPIAYNATADSLSWGDMKTFLNKIFK